MKTAIVMKDDLSIATKYDGQPMQENFGGPWGSPDLSVHIQISEEMDADCVKAELDVDNNIVLALDADKAAAKLAANREAKLNKIRDLRSPKLSRVDQLVNIAVLDSWTAGEKTELKNYRQALLDITENFKADMPSLDAIDPENMTWPTEPSET